MILYFYFHSEKTMDANMLHWHFLTDTASDIDISPSSLCKIYNILYI